MRYTSCTARHIPVIHLVHLISLCNDANVSRIQLLTFRLRAKIQIIFMRCVC